MQLLNRLKWGANWDDAKAVKGLTVALPSVVYTLFHIRYWIFLSFSLLFISLWILVCLFLSSPHLIHVDCVLKVYALCLHLWYCDRKKKKIVLINSILFSACFCVWLVRGWLTVFTNLGLFCDSGCLYLCIHVVMYKHACWRLCCERLAVPFFY